MTVARPRPWVEGKGGVLTHLPEGIFEELGNAIWRSCPAYFLFFPLIRRFCCVVRKRAPIIIISDPDQLALGGMTWATEEGREGGRGLRHFQGCLRATYGGGVVRR